MDDSFLSLEKSSRLLGGYVWVELRMFELLGGWVASTSSPPHQLILSDHCYHHAWHAELWQQRLPELRGVEIAELVQPAHPDLVHTFAEIATLESIIERFVAVYRVLLPRLLAVNTNHADRVKSHVDRPVARTLHLIDTDLRADWWEGERALQSLLDGAAKIELASSTQARFEQRLVEIGGLS